MNNRKQTNKKIIAKKIPPNSVFTIETPGGLLETMYALMPSKKKKLLKGVLKDRQVSVNRRIITQFDHQLKVGQKLEIRWAKEDPTKLAHNIKIVFEDKDLIIIDKPTGLLTVATDKEKRKTAYAVLSEYVKISNKDNKIFIVHRIDRETSGLLMFAKNEKIKALIQENWSETISERTYVAVVEGVVKEDGTVKSYLQESSAFTVYSSLNPNSGQEAITHYKVIRANDDFTLLQVNLETGRKHQIRVHMQHIGHPIVGDKKYGSKTNPIRRIGLHAMVLAFTHPKTGELFSFETSIPGKFMHPFVYNKK